MPSFGSFVDDMHPSYSVKLTVPFEMQVTLVTQLQYFIVTGEDPSPTLLLTARGKSRIGVGLFRRPDDFVIS